LRAFQQLNDLLLNNAFSKVYLKNFIAQQGIKKLILFLETNTGDLETINLILTIIF